MTDADDLPGAVIEDAAMVILMDVTIRAAAPMFFQGTAIGTGADDLHVRGELQDVAIEDAAPVI